MNKTRVYVYGLLDMDGEVFYIGKSSIPKQRLISHCDSGLSESRKMIILDIFYDTEFAWIQKYISEGINLKNKFDIPSEENWNVGDEINCKKLRVVKFRDKVSNTVFNSIKEANEKLGLSRGKISGLLYNESYRLRHKADYDFEILRTS